MIDLELEKELERVLKEATGYLTLKEIFKELKINTKSLKREVKKIINRKVDCNDLKSDNKKYILMEKTAYRKGIFHKHKNYASVIVGNKSYYIDLEDTKNAIENDEVLVHIPSLEKHDQDETKEFKKAKVEKVTKRETDYITGKVIKEDDNFYLKPDDKSKRDLKILLEGKEYIPKERISIILNSNKNNLKDNNYIVNDYDKFNFHDALNDDIEREAIKYGVYKGFSSQTLKEMEKIPTAVTEKDKIGKADLTNWEIFTIDGDDTKDIDDGVSLYKDEKGNNILGVHIACPAYYIQKDSAIYCEAVSKGTSCYPTASRVFPMLPPKLSNGICSLNPNVERLAISYIMTLDDNGKVLDAKVLKSVIKSRLQMTYNKVNDLLEKNIVHEGYEDHKEALLEMQKLSEKLIQRRKKKGCLMIDSDEQKVILDDNNKVVSIGNRKIGTAEKIIESFMVLTAETMTKFCEEHNIPCIFRNHEKPSQMRMEEFIDELKLYGYEYNEEAIASNQKSMYNLSEYLKTVDKKFAKVLSGKFIRKLKKADYGENNYHHFGLASDAYSTFTSPIRRGPDFIGQYILLELYLNKINSYQEKEKIERKIPALQESNINIKNLNINDNIKKYSDMKLKLIRNKWNKEIRSMARHFSKKEVEATKCEREINKMKIAEAMEEEIGTMYQGTLIGFDEYSMFVKLDNLIEGEILLKDLSTKCSYDKELKYIQSKNNQENYYFGDRVLVKVKSASKKKKEINFNLVEKIEENNLCKKQIKKEQKLLTKTK